MDTPPSAAPRSPLQAMKSALVNAIRFWEPRRILYNLILAAVVVAWIVFSWPHFLPAFTLVALGQLTVLALIANLCYCAAYVLDIPLQQVMPSVAGRRFRWVLWSVGTLFAFVFTNYWIADEIYPFVR